MDRTVKSYRPSSVASTRKRGSVSAAMHEKIILQDAIRRAEEAARVTKEELLAPQKRREASAALKARVTEEKRQREKYEENERKKIEHKRELEERDERIRRIREREQAIRREKRNAFRERDFTPKIDPKVKALTDHFRERVKQLESQPSPRVSSSDDEFLDALPPDSPESLDGLWGNIRRVLGRGKTVKNKRSHHKKTHKNVKKSNKMRARNKSRRKRSRRKQSRRKRSYHKR